MTVRCTYIFLHPTFKKKKPSRHFHPSPVLNVKVKYIMYKEDDPYAELCINNIINQLFTLIYLNFICTFHIHENKNS